MNNATLTTRFETVEYQPASAQQDALAKVTGTVYNPYQKEGQTDSFTIRFIAYKNNAEILREHSNRVCIVEGRLGITTSEMPSGYKEKAAHLVVEKIIPLGIGGSPQSASSQPEKPDEVLF